MEYLTFDKESLVNLEYSLNREILSTNRAGGYLNTTLPLCNTRKYHGLLVLPLKQFNEENFVLLSDLDETIVTEERNFNLGLHKYPMIYSPRGHKYLIDFKYAPVPTLWYRVGNIVVKKELIFVHNQERLLIRYTIEKSPNSFEMRFQPFLAFRNTHDLTKANMTADTRFEQIERGVSFCLYEGFPRLNLQLSTDNEWISCPDWYYNFEYKEEIDRGYAGHEDLLVPGFFELTVSQGDVFVFSASTAVHKSRSFTRKFNSELKKRPPKNTFEDCLRNAASQFVVQNGKTQIIAGFPWFGRWGRDTFIALPGLTISLGDTKTCLAVLDSMVKEMDNGIFPNTGKNNETLYNSVDAPLWFFWVLQRLIEADIDENLIWDKYGPVMKEILTNFREGSIYSISMHENGLIWQGEKGMALTWMDAVIEGNPVTPRTGYAVEICALWYNAVSFAVDLAGKFEDREFLKEWQSIPALTKDSFLKKFWMEDLSYLADFVDEKGQNEDMRPNQIFAISLPYSMVSLELQRRIIDRIRIELFTEKGLRTLSPKSTHYKGRYEGSQILRDKAYHQGTVWPWLLGHFFTSYIKVHGKDATIPLAEEVLESFQEDMLSYGIASIAEVYDGDPPHRPKGAISQAWSVAEVIRILKFVQKHNS
ncbi:amylo-alpha-1,6-glucosidase [Membranihabitans maritimus]|uniref:amylo-alpha-1,6-glucosidase n=1 Tax=Membranihabitans maritimus TaxID=2904244 RepID=UPI001F1777F8|nr:amylo-alpha-1,6-glucosidase [Membranihabitans maritimus]